MTRQCAIAIYGLNDSCIIPEFKDLMQEPNKNCQSATQLDYESWRKALRSACCWYTPQIPKSEPFVGQASGRSVYGLLMVDIGCNADRIDRTPHDIRLDDADHYYALVQTEGESSVLQNDRTIRLAPGKVALIDTARPVTYIAGKGEGRWRSLKLPRQAIIKHLGVEPPGGVTGGETCAERMLVNLLNWIEGEGSVPDSDNAYMELAIFDLLGAMFAPSRQRSVSTHTDRLFTRICGIIKERFSDPHFGPSDVAAEMKISSRYLQKLFTARGLVCSNFIQSVRLDHAARLLHRRATLDTRQRLGEIAYACGFNDYGHFARRYRQRFGRSPSNGI
jgi:AraC family transcriptional regulator, positive regulator of tynA and feaB